MSGEIANLVEIIATYRTYYVRVEFSECSQTRVLTNLTKVSRKKSLTPRGYFRYPFIQGQNRRNPPQNQNSTSQNTQPPWCYTKAIDREGLEWDPCPNIHKARAVEN